MFWQTLAPVLIDALVSSSRAPVVATQAARVGDPGATRTVYTTIVILVLLGVVLTALAIWVLRRTRPEAELLAPLETMETRGWRKLDPAAQRRLLDESRPAGAVPLRRQASAPAVDSTFATIAPVASFDDLSETSTNTDSGIESSTESSTESATDRETGSTAHEEVEEFDADLDVPDGVEPDDVDEAIDPERPGVRLDDAGDPRADDADDPLADDADDSVADDADDPLADDADDSLADDADDPLADDADDSVADDADDPVADDADDADETRVVRSIDPLLTSRRAAGDRD